MLLVDGQIFDPKDPNIQEHPQWDFFKQRMDELKLLYKKNTTESGNQKIVIKNVRGNERNPITNYPEPVANTYIPYKTTVQDNDGYSRTWRYTPGSPVTDSTGNLRYPEEGLIFGTSLVLTDKEMDKAFYLLYITPEIGFKKGNKVVGLVVNNNEEAHDIAKNNELEADVKFFIYSKHSPMYDDVEMLFKLCKAWNVPRIKHMERMYNSFIQDANNTTAYEFVNSAKVGLEKAVWDNVSNGVPVERFIEAVRKDPDWVDLRVNVLEAIDNGYIKLNKGTGAVYFDIGGEQTGICNVQPRKRTGISYVNDVVDVMFNSEDSMQILSSLGDEQPTSSTKFDPKMFDPKQDSIGDLKYSEKRALAKFLSITVPRSTKENELDKLIIEEYDRRGI